MSQILAIIPARGGSKGIPRKNVLPLKGKPLIGWTIEATRAARQINRIVVSTDDSEISNVSQKFGAEIIHRPENISGDSASSESALLHVLEYLKTTESYEPDLLVFLQCTSPLTTPQDIDGTVDALLSEQADSALAVIPFHYFLWKRSEHRDGVGINHDKRGRKLRQEREPEFLEAGAVYVMRVPGFLNARHRFFGKTAIYEMPAERRWEIDEPVDLEVAEVLLRRQIQAERIRLLPERIAAVVFDFDGVFTDNRVYLNQEGVESVACHRGDGWGIDQLHKAGVRLLVLSTERNPIVTTRCNKLNLECIQNQTNKGVALQSWLSANHLKAEEVVYLGNDVNDLECLSLVGCPVVVADAHGDVKNVAKIILNTQGGEGAVRELCDLVLSKLGELQ